MMHFRIDVSIVVELHFGREKVFFTVQHIKSIPLNSLNCLLNFSDLYEKIKKTHAQSFLLATLMAAPKCGGPMVTLRQKEGKFKYIQIIMTMYYLTDVTNRKHRVAMSKLRTLDYQLMIEQGRRKRPRIERSFRTCQRCEGCIENECRFLVACAIYIYI